MSATPKKTPSDPPEFEAALREGAAEIVRLQQALDELERSRVWLLRRVEELEDRHRARAGLRRYAFAWEYTHRIVEAEDLDDAMAIFRHNQEASVGSMPRHLGITALARDACEDCLGRGYRLQPTTEKCTACGGSGRQRSTTWPPELAARPEPAFVDDAKWEIKRFHEEHGPSETLNYHPRSFENGFDLAWDVDSTPHQYHHVAFRYPSGALCGTKLLWAHGGPLTEEGLKQVDCPTCVLLWARRGLSIEEKKP